MRYLYEKVVHEAMELIGLDEKSASYVSRTCAYLFATSHDLRSANQEILIGKWIKFWCKKPRRYGPAPETEK